MQEVLHISPTLTGFATQDTGTFGNSYMPIKFIFLLLLTLLSQLASPFPTIALLGLYNLREGTLTFLSYALVMILPVVAGFAAIYLGLYLKDPRVFQETFKLPAISFRRAKPPAPPKEKPELPVLPSPGVSWGSGRGYIWEKTVELIARRPLVGYGLDTLAYGFPQNDPGKLAGLRSYLHTTNKPHSVYLGIAYGLGVPARTRRAG